MQAWTFYPLTPTRYVSHGRLDVLTGNAIASAVAIYYGRNAKGKWRFVVNCDGFAEVGEQYETKAELLADLPRYVKTWGF